MNHITICHRIHCWRRKVLDNAVVGKRNGEVILDMEECTRKERMKMKCLNEMLGESAVLTTDGNAVKRIIIIIIIIACKWDARNICQGKPCNEPHL